MQALSTIIFIFLLSACATPSQMYWDAKVKEMCEKDGGVTVYEHIELTKEEYERNDGKNGAIRVPPETSPVNHEKYQFFKKANDTNLNDSNPRVVRYEYDVYRKSDKKLLGSVVSYARSGGDMPTGIAAGSSFSCADLKTIRLDVERQIFTVRESK